MPGFLSANHISHFDGGLLDNDDLKRVLPPVKVGVHVISPESCEIDDWVRAHIDFFTFDLEEFCDVVQR